ncbi:DUF6930 domain-containing protein [Lentibacillus saliphilus]|uniref:DUF6930 domain-containing protein n=1 Tax=Lentibacillus saliphilus TaxID=2737028 RepID=UPI003CCEA106
MKGAVVYYNLLNGSSDIEKQQYELINMINAIGGIPKQIYTDMTSAQVLTPLIETLKLNVQVQDELPIIKDIIEGMSGMGEGY